MQIYVNILNIVSVVTRNVLNNSSQQDVEKINGLFIGLMEKLGFTLVYPTVKYVIEPGADVRQKRR